MNTTLYQTDPSRHERFKAFAEGVGQLFDVAQAADFFNLSKIETAKILARWQKLGLLFRVKRGLYMVMPINTATQHFAMEDYWIIIPRLFTPCYVGGFTALEHWDLTEQIFNTICVFTAKPVMHQQIRIADQSFILRHIQTRHLFGLKPIWRGQEKVMISDMHRTIIDIFDNPEHGGGIQHAIDCLKNYLAKPEANLDILAKYAEQINNGAVYKRLGYLLSLLLGAENSTVLAFKERLTQGYAYLDPKQKSEVKLVKPWHLFVPIHNDLGEST